jgi:hypothetical protein
LHSEQYEASSVLKYIIDNGKDSFKYISFIKKYVGSIYYGSDDEIYFASLFYSTPIVTVTGISDVSQFIIYNWKTYTIRGEHLKDYIKKSEINKSEIINFLINQNDLLIYNVDETSRFLLSHLTSYFLVGGRGHWSYAVNRNLLRSDSHGGGGGGNNKLETYKLKTTKKIKNKYYQKSSAKKGTKKRKMTKKHMKSKEYKKGNKKTIKHMQ